MKIIERNVQEIGASLLITLPKGWTQALKVKKGSKLKIIVTENGALSIAPEFVHEPKKTEVTIQYDENFRRKFFKEYFSQNEKISIKSKEKFTQKEKKDIYGFLTRFMNVQVIEETTESLAVKSFRIQELSMEECLKRMHLLSLNMLDEVLQTDKRTHTEEIRTTMTRFYYMLIMQIRRFLTEGTFTSENQSISLIKAMDVRMVAEKVQRIGEILATFEKPKEKEVVVLMREIGPYYEKACTYFLTDDVERALPLWNEGNKLQQQCTKLKKSAKQKKDSLLYDQSAGISQIIRLAKEISMLVR